jgi:SAM-dependent methyltransferase
MNTLNSPPEPTPFDDGDLFDVLFHDLRYGLDYYFDLARQADGPVLDVACGTGRVLIPLLQAGVDVEGVDLFAPMLERLQRKVQPLGFQPHLHQADMRAFQIPRRFALVIIPFNSFVHNLTSAAQIETLRCCREHLLPGGLLAFDAFFPGVEYLSQPQNIRVLEMETPHPATGLPIRIFDTRTFDRIAQIQHSVNDLEELDAHGQVATTHRSATSIRWIFKSEMELLLHLAGFARWEIYGDFDRRPLERETDAMIVQAWRD